MSCLAPSTSFVKKWATFDSKISKICLHITFICWVWIFANEEQGTGSPLQCTIVHRIAARIFLDLFQDWTSSIILSIVGDVRTVSSKVLRCSWWLHQSIGFAGSVRSLEGTHRGKVVGVFIRVIIWASTSVLCFIKKNNMLYATINCETLLENKANARFFLRISAKGEQIQHIGRQWYAVLVQELSPSSKTM